MRAATAAGWDTWGFDVGPRAIQSCRSQGLRVADEIKRLPLAHFDLIILNHVFEHLSAPADTLKILRSLLGQRGRLLIEVPNVRSLRAQLAIRPAISMFRFDERHRAYPIHLSYSSPRTLQTLLKQNGWEVVRISTCGLGLEEIVRRPAMDELPSRPLEGRHLGQPKRSGWRVAAKKAFFSAGLGENVVGLFQ